MPELPEVEFARGWLSRWLTGAAITAALVIDRRILDKGVKPRAIEAALIGKRVRNVIRRGKWIRIESSLGQVTTRRSRSSHSAARVHLCIAIR